MENSHYYLLSEHGDMLEKYACSISLLPDRFPAYEKFWNEFILSLTNRDKNIKDISLKNDSDVNEDKNLFHAKLCIAQLHYSVLANLLVAHDVFSKKIDYSKAGVGLIPLTHVFSHIFSAIDIAEELILRYEDLPNKTYSAWDDSTLIKKRRIFSEKEPQKIKDAREYRNRLVHGRLLPGFSLLSEGKGQYVPKIGKEKEYLDWRKVTNAYLSVDDFQPLQDVLEEIFVLGIEYLENLWQKHLLN